MVSLRPDPLLRVEAGGRGRSVKDLEWPRGKGECQGGQTGTQWPSSLLSISEFPCPSIFARNAIFHVHILEHQ